MAINTTYTASVTQAPAAPQHAAGRITYDGTVIVATDYTVVEVGFTPRYIRWVNVTDRVGIAWQEGMTAGTSLKVSAAGANSLETTNGGITICNAAGTADTAGKYFKVLQNASLGAILASKVCNWFAIG